MAPPSPRERTRQTRAPRPTIELGATPAVLKRIEGGLAPGVSAAWDQLKEQLRRNPRFVKPDKKPVWDKAFRDIPNHRHADLPGAWRACWTIRNAGGGTKDVVTVLFIGTHKEYDTVYGFATS